MLEQESRTEKKSINMVLIRTVLIKRCQKSLTILFMDCQ